jgi:hypothetical protein
MLTKMRSKRANRIHRYLGVVMLFGNQELEFFFCKGGLLLKLPLTPLLEIILVMLSPEDEERLK